MENGLHIVYSNVNQAHMLMWCDQVLGIGTKSDMEYRKSELLRKESCY